MARGKRAKGGAELDRIDGAILRTLREDARIPTLQLAREVGISNTACRERRKKLEQGGYIRKYTILLSPEKFRLREYKYVLIAMREHNPDKMDEFRRYIANCPSVIMCDWIEGEHDFLAKIGVRSKDEWLRVHREINAHPLCRNVVTISCIESVCDHGIAIDRLLPADLIR